MADRVIFPELALFKRQLVDRFLVATHEIYRHHPTYLYNDDEEITKIRIFPSYADIQYPGKKPSILVKPGGYQFSLTDTLFKNMASEALNSEGTVAGYNYAQMMSTSVTALVKAYEEEESSDLADEFAQLMVFACRGMYGQVGLILRGVQVGETDLVDRENKVYQTSISIAVEYPWTSSKVKVGPGLEVDWNDVELVDTPIKGYEAPAVHVYRARFKD